MPTPDDLDAAVEAGVLDQAAAGRLRAFLDERRASPPPIVDPDEENFRLVGGFNDFFVVIGIVFLVAPLMFFLGTALRWASLLVGGAVVWGLAELFTRRRRMALPSIVLAILFSLDCLLMGFILAGALLPGARAIGVAAASLTAVVAALVHFRRFRVSIDVALAALGVGVAVHVVIFGLDPASGRPLLGWGGWSAVIVGVAIFALAMRFDLSDPLRRTNRADIAFWLHLFAAPLIVHGALGGRGVLQTPDVPTMAALGAAVLAFMVGAILIDRRALIVSALVYAISVMFYFLRVVGALDASGMGAALLMGVVVLALSAWWAPLRALLLPLLAPSSLALRLSPVRVKAK